MHVSVFRPLPELAPYITAIWLFESKTGIPAEDSRVIVPNGHAKILISVKNTLVVTNSIISLRASEGDVLFTGLQQYPLQISSTPYSTATIGLEIAPKGLARLCNIPMRTVTNYGLKLHEIFGAWGKKIEIEVQKAVTPQKKIDILQTALMKNLKTEMKSLSLLDMALDLITNSQGQVTIQEIEEATGYSKRYLDFLFQKYVGISPKALASILRFQKFYSEWAMQPSNDFFKANLHDHYYDQSHFIKDFKRYTGFTPQTYNRLTTDFGRIFYT